jgi:hypothetical protein
LLSIATRSVGTVGSFDFRRIRQILPLGGMILCNAGRRFGLRVSFLLLAAEKPRRYNDCTNPHY